MDIMAQTSFGKRKQHVTILRRHMRSKKKYSDYMIGLPVRLNNPFAAAGHNWCSFERW